MRKFDIYFVDLSPVEGHEQGGVRPCVIVSNNMCNKNSSVITVAPITSQQKTKIPTHVNLPMSEVKGLSADSTVLCEGMRSISKNRIRENIGCIGTINNRAIREHINECLRIQLDL